MVWEGAKPPYSFFLSGVRRYAGRVARADSEKDMHTDLEAAIVLVMGVRVCSRNEAIRWILEQLQEG